MSKFSERGYVVRENAPVYFTRDMEKTIQWFEDMLGWYGGIDERDAKGKPVYGGVFDYPMEFVAVHLTPNRGFHLFAGEPVKGVVGFLMIEGLDAFYNLVKGNGWDEITDIEAQPWGGRECRVTTPEGNILRFFEVVK